MKRDPTGQYNRRITMMFPSGVIVIDGIEVQNYVTGATVWSAWDVKSPRGKEIVVGEANRAMETRWIKIRYSDSIDATWRIRYQGTVYEIVSPPLDDGMKHKEIYLELKVVE